MRHRIPVLIAAAALVSACAIKPDDTSPQHFSAPPDEPGAQATDDDSESDSRRATQVEPCSSDECVAVCGAASAELKSKCIEAFARGCSSDQPPSPADYDCAWNKQAPEKSDRAGQPAGRREKPEKAEENDETNVNLEVVID